MIALLSSPDFGVLAAVPWRRLRLPADGRLRRGRGFALRWSFPRQRTYFGCSTVDDELKRYDGKVPHQGPDHAAPYPVSRLAPAIELVDLAREIAQADTMVNSRVSAKLKVIADQVRSLQAQAREALEQAGRDQALHHAQCNFQRRPGHTYHLYCRADGSRYFSMLAPTDWRGGPPHTFEGSYRLEADMSWTPLDADAPSGDDDSRELVARLLAQKGLT